MTNEIDTEVALQWSAVWYLVVKLFWKTLTTMWDDINKIYIKWRDKIINKCTKKIDNIDDWKSTNLRVTRDVFWNGSFSEEDIVAEYFSWILAWSRSEDAKNDEWIFYLDIIKSLSSKQLHLHYIVYNSFKKLLDSWVIDNKNINLSLWSSINNINIILDRNEIKWLWINETQDFTALYQKWLIHSWRGENNQCKIALTTLWVLLYLQAYNKLGYIKAFHLPYFTLEDFDDIELPRNIKV
jgi:hypothetical protein